MTQEINNKIDGKQIAATIRGELAEEISALTGDGRDAPHLVVIIVGERKDSQTYVRMKTRACAEVGIKSTQHELPGDSTQEALLALVRQCNEDATVNGILVQLPLPEHLNADEIIEAIDPSKDVDGLTSVSQGRLAQLGHRAPMVPCTPLGCIELLDRKGVEIEGVRAVVLGRSQLVGKPVAQLLLSRNATVTMCHSRTKDIESIVRESDIVIAAVGRPNFVQGAWLKKGCAVIDVGINAVDDATRKRGYRLVGDVDFAAAQPVAGLITPVPGGVGPMTVAMLLRNTLKSYKLTNKIDS